MASAVLKRALLALVFAAIVCAAAFYQVFITSNRVLVPDRTLEIEEAVQNAAAAQPEQFNIEASDVHTLHVSDSVPSAKDGVFHVYVQQEAFGIPITNTLLSTIVKLAPMQGGDSSLHGNYLRASDESEGGDITEVVKVIPSKEPAILVKNLENCIATSSPKLTTEEALLLVVSEVLGVNDAKLNRRILNESDNSVRQRSVFAAHDGISIKDTVCQLSFWSGEKDCDVRLSWDCKLMPNSSSSMELFIDAEDGKILHIIQFGTEETFNEEDTTSQEQQEPDHPTRRRLSTFSAVPYPNESPCYNCPAYKLNMSDTETTFDVADIESLSLVKDPEYLESSPNGWLTVGDVVYDTTQGNNVRAAVDVVYPSLDYYSTGSSTKATTTDKSYSTFDYSELPIIPESLESAPDKPEAAVVNAFYWANICHDILYQYGFDEASGNFQEDNFDKGGIGGDSVLIDVRETMMTNNAVFLPTADGENPLMILFLFVRSNAQVVLKIAEEEFTALPAAFGPTEYNITGADVIYSNGIECEPVDDNAYEGAIVAIDRGTCVFTMKVKNAQDRGAVGVIIMDNVDGPLFAMSGSDQVDIPAVSITKEDGERLKSSLPTSNSILAVENPGLIIRDASFDSGVIVHEYCHGLSTRLTGGPSNQFCVDPRQAKENGSEGWSDFCSLFITATSSTGRTRTVGSFASWSIEGIRSVPYDTDMNVNPSTYSNINMAAKASGGDATHFVGTIFNTMLWEMYWGIIDFEEENGRLGYNDDKYQSDVGGSNIAMQLVVEGLKTQPCFPTFVDSRDAILTADEILYDERYKCVIWTAFAKRGVGESAVGSPLGTIDVEENFDVPIFCKQPWLSLTSFNYTIESGDGDEYIDNCEVLQVRINFKNTGLGNLTNVQMVEVSTNTGMATTLDKLPMQLSDFPERELGSIDFTLLVEGLSFGEPLKLEAKFLASEVSESEPISIPIVFEAETSTDLAVQDSVTWDFEDGNNNFTGVSGFFSLEPSRSALTVDGMLFYSPVSYFGPQNFTLEDLSIQDGQGLGCEQVNDDKYIGSIVLIERGQCDFTDKVLNAQLRGASAVVVINNVNSNPFNMAGEDPNINIPAVMVSTSDGNSIKQIMNSTLASLAFDASKKEMISSFTGIAAQCNRVQSPPFLLRPDTKISLWVNYGIRGIITGGQLYDRANVGLFNGKDRLTIKPDGGEKYNSNQEVPSLSTCPAPGDSGWRESNGATFKEVVFSTNSLKEAGMFGQIVYLDIALATGMMSYGSFISVQRVELQNVGIMVEDKGSSMCPKPSAAPSITPSQEPSIHHSHAPSIEKSLEPSTKPSWEPTPQPTSSSPIDILRSGDLSESPVTSDGSPMPILNKFMFFLVAGVGVVFSLI